MSRGTWRRRVIPCLETLEGRLLPTVKVTGGFAGTDYITAQAGQPPDTDVAAGPQFIGETVNLTLTFFDRNTAAIVFRQKLGDFFGPAGANGTESDPLITYDELTGRFVVSVLEFNFTAHFAFLDFAVSRDANPADGFDLRRIDIHETTSQAGLWGDFPKVGWNADAYVFTMNMFPFPGQPGGFAHVQIVTIAKGNLTVFRTDRPNSADFTIAPATMHGARPGDPMWLVEEDPQGGGLILFQMTNILSTSPSFASSSLTVDPYSDVVPPKQPGGRIVTTNIDSAVSNADMRNGVMVVGQNVGRNSVTQVRWYEIELNASTPTVLQSGTIDQGPGIFTYFPAIDIGPSGNLGMSFIESSASENMSMYVTGRTANDADGTMEKPVRVAGGQAVYNGSRAGDFSGISIDPLDGTFWAGNEYSTIAGTRNWGTWVSHFMPGGADAIVSPASGDIVVGVDEGVEPFVRVFDAATHDLLREFLAYDPAFLGGVRVAVSDLGQPGHNFIVTAPGPNSYPDIRVFDADTGAKVKEFMAYDPSFSGGVYVAVGDVNGDGVPDIITGADAGGGPHVKVFDGQTGAVLMSFFAYDASFTGGVRVASADVNGDGHADIITGAGPGGGPHVKVFSGADGSVLRSFFAYDISFTGGVFVAAGDVNGDGRADIITGAGSAPHVKVFSGANGFVLDSFFAYDPSFIGGARVSLLTTTPGQPYILTSPGAPGGPDTRLFNPLLGTRADNFFAFDIGYFGGVFVGGK